MREKYISFAQLVLLSLCNFERSVFTFQCLNDKIHNYVKKKKPYSQLNCELFHSQIEK